MIYHDLVRDFAQRTRSNLETLRDLQRSDPDQEIYEVTQLINSMLGLLVFPQQQFFNGIPETDLERLVENGWPVPEVEGDYPQAKDLKELMRYLRNSVAHFNIEFVPEDGGQIAGLKVWNKDPRTGRITWRARLTIDDLEKITDRFIGLLLDEEERDSE